LTPVPEGHRTHPPPAVLQWLGLAYGRAAAWRRAWYVNHPSERRRLDRPVVSVGNLTVGGSGKTPVVAHLARWLLAQGERPAILSRGYARRVRVDGVLVVSDAVGVREPVERSGDEPQMLARSLPGVPVLVCADRHLAGTLAERQFGCTVHLLDDGFQHHALCRDVDLVLVAPGDFEEYVLPAGRLREPAEVATEADAFIVAPGSTSAGDPDDWAWVAASAPTGVPVFEAVLVPGRPVRLAPFGVPLTLDADAKVMALAGIARPERFFQTVRAMGWRVVKERAFRDHHWFSAREVAAIAAAAADADADVVLTTEKDAMRLVGIPRVASAVTASSVPFGCVSVGVTIEPADRFGPWLLERLGEARAMAVSQRRGVTSA
jgi:tetraacyldisaccharide 4'-kinase